MLCVWLPLNGDLHNQGLSDVTVTNNGATVDNNGKIGKCYSFGSNKRIYSTIDTNSLNSNAISFACWINISSWNSSYDAIMSIADGTSWNQSRATLSRNNTASTLTWNIANGSTSARVSTTSNIPLNTWTHIATTYDGLTLKIYVNGILNNSTQTSLSITYAGGLCIGSWSNTNNYPLNGRINDVRIYDHALSDKEVEELAKGLILHYKLDQPNPNLLSQYVVPGQANPGSTATAGRTNYYGDYGIIIPATENADTYFRLFLKQQLVEGKTYTISCNVSGLLAGSFYNFPLFAQGNGNMGVLSLNHNGLCSLTFTMNSSTQTAITTNGQTLYVCFMDDNGRTITSGQGAITVTGFKIEEGNTATPCCLNDESNIIYDSSGYNNNGIIAGSLITSNNTPRYNISSYFDGNTAAIQTPNLKTMITDKTYTISCWTYKTQIGNKGYQTIYGGPGGFELEARSGGSTDPLFRIHNWGGGTTPYEFNKWYHFCFVHSDNNSKLYINGELKLTGTSVNIPSGNYFIGAWNSATQQNYDGNMSDFRIYCTALTEAQIKELYNTSATIDNLGNTYARELVEI